MADNHINGQRSTELDQVANAAPRNTPTFAFEHVAARLVPFDLQTMIIQDAVGNMSTAGIAGSNHALLPIMETGGLVFPYTPSISEGVSVKYQAMELVHANESVYSYMATDNRRITISDSTWTCDTFENAIYTLSVIHFFRSYSQMDFGKRRSARPPAPMWFSAFGNYAFHRVPCLLEKADWSWPKNEEVDYVGVPEPGTTEYAQRKLAFSKSASGSYTWLPVEFKVSSISLIVQHAPKYWETFNLDDYRSGAMLRRNNSFDAMNRG